MANIDCNSCNELVETSPDFVENGVTTAICNSLKNDTGFNSKKNHTDCEDLDAANDCLVGMMDKELEKHEPCDWKLFMHEFIPNIHQLLKAMICAICGLWTNVHALWEEVTDLWKAIASIRTRLDALESAINTINGKINTINNSITNIQGDITDINSDIAALERKTNKIDCIVDYLSEGSADIYIGEDTSGDAYAVAGKGVSFLNVDSGTHSSNIYMRYIAGGLMSIGGSYIFYDQDFQDAAPCKNFDPGSTEITSQSRIGNSVWASTGRTARGGELICEFRVKKSVFPFVKQLFTGFGFETGAGGYHVQIIHFREGSYAYGQHGWCDEYGRPSSSGYDQGHLVPNGWVYTQLRSYTRYDIRFRMYHRIPVNP